MGKTLSPSQRLFFAKHKKPSVIEPPIIETLRIACHNGNVDQVREILTQNPSYLNIKLDNENFTPFLIAIYRDHTKLAEFLLQQPGIDVSIRTPTFTALGFAFHFYFNFDKPDYDMAFRLIEKGADVNEVIERDATLLLKAWWTLNKDKSTQMAMQLVTRFGASIEISENLFNNHLRGTGYFVDEEIPKRIALTKKYVEEIKNAKQLGQALGNQVHGFLQQNIDLVIAEFLFDANSEEINAFKQGRTETRGQLTPAVTIHAPLTFMRQLEDEIDASLWAQKYNKKHPDREKHGFGPGAMIPCKSR